MTDHLNSLIYEFLTYYFKRDTDINVFNRIDPYDIPWIDQMSRFIEGVKSLSEKEDEMTEKEIDVLKNIN